MQSWPGSGQNGAGGQGQGSWAGDFPYASQDDRFDPSQSWPQTVTEPPGSFSHINGHQDAHARGFFNPASHQEDAFLASSLHHHHPEHHHHQGAESGFHAGHGNLGLNQQFAQAGQDVIDPAFNDMTADIFEQSAKGNMNMNQVQSHPHAHPQNFAEHDFTFTGQHEHSFDPSSVPHFTPSQQLSSQPSPNSHGQASIQQHFGDLSAAFQQQEQGFSRQTQPSPSLHQPSYSQQGSFTQNINSQQISFNRDAVAPLPFQQQPHQQHQRQQSQVDHHQHSLNGPSSAAHTPVTYSQVDHQPPPQGLSATAMQHKAVTPDTVAGQLQAAVPASSVSPQPKKRKRPSKTSPVESPVVDNTLTTTVPDFLPEANAKKAEDTSSLPIPVPNPEEAKMIADFGKRNKAAQTKHPSIKGLPHMVYDGSIKLTAPKSFDKLAPLVALPSRNGQPMVPEMGGMLPCEVQGRFTSNYRPSPDKGGLDERRAEAKVLLDEYDQSMRSLGKRQPKYTEYPHAFKEQLKSDEATKQKAEKKAKKSREDERHKPIRQPTRPSDPIEAAVWDTIGFVLIDQTTPRTSSLIAGRVQQAGDYIIKLRADMNRAKLEAEEAVKDKLAEDVIAKRRTEAEAKKEALYRALDATVEHADDAVLDNLGGHQKLILSLINCLISCIKASDFSGRLPKIVLELFTHFRMTRKIVDAVNFDTVRKRFGDRGDDEVKDLIRDISAKIKKFVKTSDSESAATYTGTSAASRAKAGVKSAVDHTMASSTKRVRDDDADATRTVKKIAVEAGTNSLSKKLAQPKSSLQSTVKTAASKPATSSALLNRSRPVAKSAVKLEPSGAVGSPTASTDELSKADGKKAAVKVEPKISQAKSTPTSTTATPAPTSSALSGIASLLDSINSKKTEAASAASKDSKGSDGSETPEQRAKRLRKESRRKLRVSWKPDEDLVQTRVFHKDDGEDEGRDVNMLRDAADDRSEGMMLKQRANVDDEDDEEDIPYQPWVSPNPTDFSHLPAEVRGKSYVTRGGDVTFSTEEQKLILEREQRELMAIYTDVDDIPPTPKSPPPEQQGSEATAPRSAYIPTDDPNFQELQLRWREEQQLGVDEALMAALRRLEAKNASLNSLDSIFDRLKAAPSHSSSHQRLHAPHSVPTHQSLLHHRFPFAAGAPVEEQVYACLQSEKTKAWRDPNPMQKEPTRSYHHHDKTLQLIDNHIETVARNLAGKPYPATSPPDWIARDEERVREWWLAFNKEAAMRQRKLDDERAKAEAEALRLMMTSAGQPPGQSVDWNAYLQQQQQQQQQQHQSYAPYLALLQHMTGGQAPQPAVLQALAAADSRSQQGQIPDNQLQSILAAINQQQQQPASINPLSNPNPNDQSYQQLLLLTQMTQGQSGQPLPPPPPPPPPPQQSHDRDRDRDLDRDWDRGDSRDRDSGKDGRKKKATLPVHKPANKALIGTKACMFWQHGKCARGDKCTFRHD